jgi:hypothetical protein
MKHFIVGSILSSWLVVLGCASEPSKTPNSQPTHKDVRGDSDRFFDKMKQDEKEHGSKMKESGP